MPPTTPPCANPDCDAPALFRWTKREAWCADHTREVFSMAGVTLLELPTKRGDHVLTRCNTCGAQAHYRLDYALDKAPKPHDHSDDFPGVCRACYWTAWAAKYRDGVAGAMPHRLTPIDPEEARAVADAHGFDYLRALTNPSLPGEPHHVRCRNCGVISAKRLDDIAFDCHCQTNKRTATAPRKRTGTQVLADWTDLARWWDHANNPAGHLETLTMKARREAAWKCPECGHRFHAPVHTVTQSPVNACPECAQARKERNLVATAKYATTYVADYPDLLAAWDDEADPRTATVGGWRQYTFACPNGHHPKLTPRTYLERGCQFCRRQGLPVPHLLPSLSVEDIITDGAEFDAALAQLISDTTADQNVEAFYKELVASIEVPDPHQEWLDSEIASQWHPTANAPLSVGDVNGNSKRVLWWQCHECGYDWQASPRDREKYTRRRCPECASVLDSLGWHYPDLAKQWAPDNPLTVWQVRPTGKLDFTPLWICPDDPAHTWVATTASRVGGSGCPQCAPTGKSGIELVYLEAFAEAFGHAHSGRQLTSPAFVSRSSWEGDIVVDLPDGRTLVVEYDGAYWHADPERVSTDIRKTEELLAARFLVVRLRESPLNTLPLVRDRLMQLSVHPHVRRPSQTASQVAAWVEGTL